MSYESTLINNREKAKQILAFDGLQYGLCRPTDIDLSMDFKKECFIFGELKSTGSTLTVGQRIHLEGLVDAIRAGGKLAYAFVAHHDTPDCEEDVHVAEAIVAVHYDGENKWKRISLGVNEYIQAVYDTYKSMKKRGIA